MTTSPNMVVDAWRAEGSDKRLLDFLAWWNVNGSFIIRVAWQGGPRTPAEQLALWAKGRGLQGGKWVIVALKDVVTWAQGPDDAPHVHAGAVAVEPLIEGRALDPKEGAQFYDAIAAAAVAKGLVAGNNWAGVKKDARHLEVPNFRALPLYSNSAELVAGAVVLGLALLLFFHA